MKILYILQDFPYPPISGFHWKAYSLIKYMAKEHECHILSFGKPPKYQKIEEFKRIFPQIKILGIFPPRTGIKLYLSQLISIIRGLPPSLARFKSKNFIHAYKETIQSEKYDIIHYDMINMAQYYSIGKSLPSVLSPNDAVSLAYQRLAKHKGMFSIRKFYLLLSSKLISRFERNIYSSFSKVHVVSPIDYKYLYSISPKIKLEIIAHTVSDDYLTLNNRTPNNYNPKEIKLLFTGSLKNPGIVSGLLEFLGLSYPLITREFPQIQLTILGRDAPLSVCNYLNKLEKVKFLPWVDDYIKRINNANIVIFTDKSGSGLKTRVLQAMALGKPIVATPIAIEGIAIKHGIHCLVAETPVKFSQSIIALLKDPERQKSMGKAAKDLILKRYTMKSIGPKWLELYQSAIRKFKYDTTKVSVTT